MLKIKDVFKVTREANKRVLEIRRLEKKMEMYRKLYGIRAEKVAA